MKSLSLILLLLLGAWTLPAQETPSLVWSDEFDVPGLPNPEKWTYETGNGCPNVCGWGNNELEFYTEKRPENARVERGKLIIEARKEPMGDMGYTSARLVTKGIQDWKYGRFEIRAKLPTGRGTWPAIWMMPSSREYGGWPRCGEIDIMEHVGYESDVVYGTVHTEAFNHMIGTQKGDSMIIRDAEDAYHVYAIDWQEDGIAFFIDGEQYHYFPKAGSNIAEWPFDQPFYLILNIAVGGNWGGSRGVDETIWPQTMEVDWVRVYQ